MDIKGRLAMSYYKTIDTLNEDHKIYLVKHLETGKIYVKKILDIYNKDIYVHLKQNPIKGIPTIIEMCEEDSQLIVIENYISGTTLSEFITSTTPSLDALLNILLELCDILEPLHNENPPIVHRDIKPSNIIISEYGHPILLDFNAAKYCHNPESNDTILLGTKGYAAPEQYGFGSSSPKTDIYALGILLREMLNSLNITPSRDIDKIITKCTQINPEDRYSCVTDLKEALLHICAPDEVANVSQANVSAYEITGAKRFLPPGYRSLTPWKMIYSTLGYAFLIWMTCTLKFKNNANGQPISASVALIEKLYIFITIIGIIFFNGNYLGIQKHFSVCRHNNRIIRYLGLLLIDVTIIFTLFIPTIIGITLVE